MDMNVRPKIGLRIRRAMERQRMTQEQLAQVLGVSRGAVNNWINDKAYPANSIGALEHVLRTDLTSEDEQLPQVVADNLGDERVLAVWNRTDLHTATKLSVIRHMLAEDEALPQVVADNSDLYEVVTIWNQSGFTRADRIHLIRNWLRLRHPERLPGNGEPEEGSA